MSRDRADVNQEIEETYGEISALRERVSALRRERGPEDVKDYVFAGPDGAVKLSGLFGDKPDLLVVHNMGRTCPMCTLWADGFNGILPHLEDRCAFVVSTPDAPDVQREFAESRGWRFRMVSTQGTSFAADMGYEMDGHPWPGVSVFQLRGGEPVRVGDASFGPGDDFNPMLPLLTLFPEGRGSWTPKLRYA